MNCENCKQEFQLTKTNGTIQKYCSLVCRNKAANTRRIEKIIEKHHEATKTQTTANGNGTNNIQSFGYNGNYSENTTENDYQRNGNNNIRPESGISTRNNFGNERINIGHIENLYETKSLLSISNYELSKAQEKIQQLQSELNDYYEEDEEIEKLELAQKQAPQHEQILKSFADMFREDPVNTTNMVKTLVPSIIGGITDMFKTKTNEKTN